MSFKSWHGFLNEFTKWPGFTFCRLKQILEWSFVDYESSRAFDMDPNKLTISMCI